MRKSFIAGNWKMYKTINESLGLVNNLKRSLADVDSVDIVVCPVYTSLSEVSDMLMDSNIGLGGQNVFWEKEGAYTGEISPIMLKDSGCEFVIVGHSERRKYFSETNETVNKKLKAVLGVGLTPICCIGETLEEREAKETISVIETQLKGCLKDIEIRDILGLVIAYEPVWAIGTGKNATPDQAQEVHNFIRGWIEKNFSQGAAETVRILYGGSVKPSNIKDLMKETDIDGALVGGASLEASSFIDIVKNAL